MRQERRNGFSKVAAAPRAQILCIAGFPAKQSNRSLNLRDG